MSNAKTFAELTDQMIAGGQSLPGVEDADLALARRLRETGGEWMMDPAFRDGLRSRLLMDASEETASVAYAAMDSPIGPIFIAYRNGMVVAAGAVSEGAGFERRLAVDLKARPRREAAPPEPLRTAVTAHLEGGRRFSKVDIRRLQPFHRLVLEKASEIPHGEVRPYSWIARELGKPGAARAVGTALAHNPIPFIIPCHRVVRADGTFGEYSGGGPENKLRILQYEGVDIEGLAERVRRGAVYAGSASTRVYCYPTCRAARRISPEMRRDFASQEAAREAGYRPCKLCRP